MLAVVIDAALLRSPKRLALERELPQRVGLGVPFERRIRLSGPGAAFGLAVDGELREQFPDTVAVSADSELEGASAARARGAERDDPTGGPERFRSSATEPVELARNYAGAQRGRVVFGDVRVRLIGPLGLVARQARFSAEQVVAVEPPLTGLSRRLALVASERWRDLGLRAARRPGGATEFESLREYVSGDDVRSIDWKGFARRSAPLVREFQDERGQELLIAIDCGRAMMLCTALGAQRGWTKLDSALDAALQLAAVALRAGDRVGALAFDARTRAWVAPRRGTRQLQRLRETLFDLQPVRVASDLERALAELALRHRRSATVVILSDVADPLSVDDQRRALRAATRNHRLVFAALDDPDLRAVLERSDRDPLLVGAAERLLAERQASLAALARGGARVLSPIPAESAGPLIAAWLAERGRFVRRP